MAQGLRAKKQTTATRQAASKRSAKKLTVKEAKALKPKKKSAQDQAKFAKKHTAALTSATEKLLSSRVGHLELLKGTRREIEKNALAKKAGANSKPKPEPKPKPKELPLVLESPRPAQQRVARPKPYESFVVRDEFDIAAYKADHPHARLVREGDALVDVNADDASDVDYVYEEDDGDDGDDEYRP